MATSHHSEIKIWDIKQPKIPHQYISAHPCKIFALDFSPVKENQLVSSAADNTIKMWDVTTSLKKPVNVLRVQGENPVWKVRYTPFGEGLVTLLYTPAMRREQENNLMLWSASPQSTSRGPGTFFSFLLISNSTILLSVLCSAQILRPYGCRVGICLAKC